MQDPDKKLLGCLTDLRLGKYINYAYYWIGMNIITDLGCITVVEALAKAERIESFDICKRILFYFI